MKDLKEIPNINQQFVKTIHTMAGEYLKYIGAVQYTEKALQDWMKAVKVIYPKEDKKILDFRWYNPLTWFKYRYIITK